MLVAVLLGLALSAPPENGPQFDLVCRETLARGRPSTPEYRFRIDLSQNRWCEGECESPREIASVTADRYTLVDSEYRSLRLRTVNKSWIDRVTGEHYENNQSIGGLTQINTREGQCERAPYSGMPEPRL
jgi:hypothetical protein